LSDERGDSEHAREYFYQALKEDPTNAKLLYNFVAFLLKKGDVINALFYLETALSKHYEERFELFERLPEAEHDQQVMELVEYYNQK
jgi:Tfp pilus assembly protein PilF